MLKKTRLNFERADCRHITEFGFFGKPLSRFADAKGFVCWDADLRSQARLLQSDELEYEYSAWVKEMDSSDWGEMDSDAEDPNDPENYADWRYLRNGAAAYAVEKAVRNLEKWRKIND